MIEMAKIVQVVNEQVPVTDSVKVTVHRAEPPMRKRINWPAWITTGASIARLIIDIIDRLLLRAAIAGSERVESC